MSFRVNNVLLKCMFIGLLYVTGNSLTGSDKSTNVPSSSYQYNRPAVLHSGVDNFDMMEYPFVTLLKYPLGFIVHLGRFSSNSYSTDIIL